MSQSLESLLDIQPKKLPFVFELGRKLTSEFHLANITQHYVAFKILVTDPKKYAVQHPNGVILPNSTCEVIVTMQVQKIAPPDMICEDKFLIKSTVVPSGTLKEEITSNLFLKEGKYDEEEKFLVEFVRPPLPIIAPFKEKEGLLHLHPKSTNQNNVVEIDQIAPKFKGQNAASKPLFLKFKSE